MPDDDAPLGGQLRHQLGGRLRHELVTGLFGRLYGRRGDARRDRCAGRLGDGLRARFLAELHGGLSDLLHVQLREQVCGALRREDDDAR